MQYILTAGWEDGVADLTERLARELSDGRRVLWLVSGGSNIPASVQVMNNISATLTHNLGIMLSDERYGPFGHSQSNWSQLLAAGFKLRQAKLCEVLQAELSAAQTVARYNQLAAEAFAEYELVIAQLGVGPDGHITGIKPGSPAATETKALVVGYPDPPLHRLTLTFPALRRIDAAYVFAFGDTKHQALTRLHNRTLPLNIQPAQILKELPEVYVYSDQIGEHA